MTTLPPPPSGINLDDDKRASIMVTSIVTWCMAALVVGLRIVSRRLKNIDLWIDDWLIIAALILVTILQCQPTSAWWERFNPTHPLQPEDYKCTVDSVKFFYGNAIPTIVTDILILLLPLPYITTLQLPRGQKWALAGIFCVGLFVTIVSIVRLHYLLQGNLTSPDITWNFVNIALWSVVEGNTAIFCGKHVPSSRDLPSLWVIFSDSLSLPPACLPFLRPVLSKFSFGIFSLSSVPSKKQPSSGTRGTLRMSYYQKDGARPWQGDGRFVTTTSHSRAYSHAHETDEHPFAHLTDDGSERSIPVKEGQDDSQIELDNVSPPRGPIEPNGIVVTREFHLQHQEAQHQDV
ncbi:hypothetical protein ACHAO4_006410 [Trichoderma viride]